MNLIQSFIAIPQAAAEKQNQQIKAATNTQGNQFALSPAPTSPQVLPFKKQNNESERNEVTERKAV